MAIQDPRNLDWISHNAIRSYPLAVHASKQSTNGLFTLPDDFIVGLNITLPSRTIGYNPDRFFISRIRSDVSGYTIYISYDNNDVSNIITLISIPYRDNMERGTPFTLTGLNSYATLKGVIEIGTFESIRSQPPGDWLFNLEATRLDATICRITPISITAVYIKNLTEVRGPYYGDITFASGSNTRITETMTADTLTIRIDAIDTSGFNDNPNSGESTFNVKTINHVKPNAAGNIELVTTDECFNIAATGGNIITITDNCSHPCCDCEELAVVTDQLVGMQQQIDTLMVEQGRLANYIDNLGNNILGSQINDISCVQCGTSELAEG